MTLVELVFALAGILGALQGEGATTVVGVQYHGYEDGSAVVMAQYAGPSCPLLEGDDACWVRMVRDAETGRWTDAETGP